MAFPLGFDSFECVSSLFCLKLLLLRQEIHGLGPMDLQIYGIEKKTRIVTRQLTKSRDFCQNYICDFHHWKRRIKGYGVIKYINNRIS
jgi:hypothetical protein